MFNFIFSILFVDLKWRLYNSKIKFLSYFESSLTNDRRYQICFEIITILPTVTIMNDFLFSFYGIQVKLQLPNLLKNYIQVNIILQYIWKGGKVEMNRSKNAMTKIFTQ